MLIILYIYVYIYFSFVRTNTYINRTLYRCPQCEADIYDCRDKQIEFGG